MTIYKEQNLALRPRDGQEFAVRLRSDKAWRNTARLTQGGDGQCTADVLASPTRSQMFVLDGKATPVCDFDERLRHSGVASRIYLAPSFAGSDTARLLKSER